MLVVVEVDVALVVFERDRPLGETEAELSVGAFAIFPAGVCALQKLADQAFDIVARRCDLLCEHAGVEHDRLDGDVRGRKWNLRAIGVKGGRLLE